MVKTLLAAAVLGLGALSSQLVLAHGSAAARHGGVAVMASDLSFELVAVPTGAVIYIEDHGKPLALTGIKGRLTVLNGSEKSVAVLEVAGDKLVAKGIQLAKGAKVVAALTTPAAKTITVRFTFK